MSRPRNEEARVLGPYWNKTKGQWFAKILVPRGDEPGCRARDRWLGADEQEARAWVDEARAKLVRLHCPTFDGALTTYRQFLVDTGHKSPSNDDTADERVRRLKLFFEEVMDVRLSKIDEDKAEELYRSFAVRTYTVGSEKNGTLREKPYSVAHHRHTLSCARTFMQWCVKPQRWIAINPFSEVKGVGKRNTGKEQLTGNEAIKFYEHCASKAKRGDEAALALIMCLVMALRQGDVRRRVVRDIDLDGTRLVIGVGSSARSKTAKGDRGRKIPVVLQPLINKLVEGRSPLEPLFKAGDGGFHTKTWLRLAAKRLCAEAGVPYVPPHGLKGTAGSLAADGGALANQVAEYLSHASAATSKEHYVGTDALVEAEAAAALKLLVKGAA